MWELLPVTAWIDRVIPVIVRIELAATKMMLRWIMLLKVRHKTVLGVKLQMVLVLLSLIFDFSLNFIFEFSHMLVDANFDLLVDQLFDTFPHIIWDFLFEHLILGHFLLLCFDLWWCHFSASHRGVRSR